MSTTLSPVLTPGLAQPPATLNPLHAPAPRFYDDGTHHPQQGTLLGFWLYLMSDCLIFAVLFAVYAVMGTYGFAMIGMQQRQKNAVLGWLALTGLLGAGFIGLELYEFAHLIHEGAGPQRSAFLSSFFALVGTHGLHVSFGIVWLGTLMLQVKRFGLHAANRRRLMCLSMFWHFLDVIWIGVFSFVYLMGVVR